MKAKLAIVTLLGLTACNLVLAQNEPAAAAAPPTPTVIAAPPAAEPAPPPPSALASGAVIPLIQFQDVPLTTAIENLARQAGINYILDPKVGYGQPDEKGQMRTQPNISIRWENLTAEQALTALITTYGLQIVDDPKSKIARVTIKDPAAAEPLETRVIQLKYTSPTNIIGAVQTSLTDKRSKVMADIRTSQLVVSATEKEQDAVSKLVEQLDTITKQVLIEAKLVETSQNPQTIKGINWAGTLEAQKVSYGNNNQNKPVSDEESTLQPNASLWPKMIMQGGSFNPATAFLNADGLSATLSFLNQSADSKVIATPRAVTLDNEPADLSVTRAQPIFKTTAGTQGSPGGSEVTYTNLGVILNVTPRISANNYVNLHVIPEVSRVSGIARKVVAGTINEADIYDIRKVETRVMIPSGNTLVMGGLVSDGTTTGNVKVPVLGDIPWIGLLFRQDSKKREQSNLIIFITPTIVEDTDFHVSKSDYLKTSPDLVQPDKAWSAWDEGTPKDWSNKGSNNPDSPVFQ
ncbi:MAG: type II secretion system protein GspD [Verrucomicrobia subdivision 3 bacterium]|nr:type II secretion system protein GspD [Limisphaerales bacterium]